jgi:hypothetical protein
MSSVNFIADPWEYPAYNELDIHSGAWMSRYEAFRVRLHWLLLWNREVHILDTFTLFNRQFEHWVTEEYRDEGIESRKAKEHLFQSRAIRVALRRNDGDSFNCLAEVDEAHVRGSKDFIWYPDGKPKAKFVADLDSRLGLSRAAPLRDNPTWVIGNHQRELKEAFEAAVNPSSTVSSDFGISGLPSEEIDRLWALIDNDWRRSKIYKVLGFGVDWRLRGRKPLWKYVDDDNKNNKSNKNRTAAERLRRLADWCYYRAINQDLGLESRFPDSSLPLSLDSMFVGAEDPAKVTLGITPQSPDTLDMRQQLLADSAICLTGNVSSLFEKFGKLTVAEVSTLRTRGEFAAYYQLRREGQGEGKAIWDDPEKGRKMSEAAFSCLQALGDACQVPIEKTTSSKVRLGLRMARVASKCVATGIAMSISPEASELQGWFHVLPLMLDVGIEAAGEKAAEYLLPALHEKLIYISTRLHRVSPSDPVVVAARCTAGVTTEDIL